MDPSLMGLCIKKSLPSGGVKQNVLFVNSNAIWEIQLEGIDCWSSVKVISLISSRNVLFEIYIRMWLIYLIFNFFYKDVVSISISDFDN